MNFIYPMKYAAFAKNQNLKYLFVVVMDYIK